MKCRIMLFAKQIDPKWEKCNIFFRKNNLRCLNIYNGPFWLNCIKLYRKFHWSKMGLSSLLGSYRQGHVKLKDFLRTTKGYTFHFQGLQIKDKFWFTLNHSLVKCLSTERMLIIQHKIAFLLFDTVFLSVTINSTKSSANKKIKVLFKASEWFYSTFWDILLFFFKKAFIFRI